MDAIIAWLAKLGRVAIDGSKVRANASKHKAMSYGRLKKKDAELKKIVKDMFDEAERIDAEEDALYGKGNRGDELPEELRNAKTRRKKIREAIKNLKARKKAQADAKRAGIAEKEKVRDDDDRPRRGRKPKEPSDEPDDKMQHNFTDPESRIMVDGAMNTRAVASLDLGAAWLVHMSWHSLDGSDRPSETRVSVGVALKALELTAGWTRDRGPAGEEDFLEVGARLWWAF